MCQFLDPGDKIMANIGEFLLAMPLSDFNVMGGNSGEREGVSPVVGNNSDNIRVFFTGSFL